MDIMDMVDRLGQMTLTVTSPDGNLIARLRGEYQVGFEFRDPDRVGGYDIADLEHQTAALLRGMETGRRRGVRLLVEEAGLELAEPDDPLLDESRRRYLAAADRLEARGRSCGGAIRIRAFGTRVDAVRIDPDAVPHLDAAAFIAELDGAYRDLLASRRVRGSQLKAEHGLL